MRNKLIPLLIVFLLVFGLLNISFGTGIEIPNATMPPGGQQGGGTPTPGGNQSGGGTPDNGNQSGGGNQTTITTVQTGTIYVSQNSQDLVIVKKKSTTVVVNNTTTPNNTITPGGNKSYLIIPRVIPYNNSTVRVRAPPAPDNPWKHLNGNATVITPGDIDNGGGTRQTGPYRPPGGYNNSFIPDESGTRVICLTQTTAPGTIPHELQSSNGEIYYAFCMEPWQKASVGESLTSNGNAPAVIYYLAENSNPEDLNNAYKTQLKIWALVAGGNLDPNTGEAIAMKKSLGISDTQFNQDIKTVKDEITKEYGAKPEQFTGLLDYKAVNLFGYNLLENIIIGFKHLLGIYTPYQPLSNALTSGTKKVDSNNANNEQQQVNTQKTQVQQPSTNQTPATPGTKTCSNCGGTGKVSEPYTHLVKITCTECGGSGQVWDSIDQLWITCKNCHGTGSLYQYKTDYRDVTCPVCGGKGYENA